MRLADAIWKLIYSGADLVSRVAILAMIAGALCGVAVRVFRFFYDLVLL